MAELRYIDEVIAAIPAGRVVVGIAGAPGAGKSTFAAAVAERMPGSIVLPMDGFHLPQAELRRLGRRDRMGAPDTFDIPGLVATLRAVQNSSTSVWAPAFDREIEEPVPDAIEILQELRTVIVEGNYLLLWDEVRPLLDVTFFLDIDDEVRRRRLVDRHMRYGKSGPAAAAWVASVDEPNARTILATAARADHRITLA